jgi:peptidoglycan/xylan/chitin deacetylase (PgdA/CDA1 family)
MRLDRRLTLQLFRPLCRAGLGRREDRLPILMYHSVSDDPEEGVRPYYRVATNPRRFAEHMEWLTELGYSGVSLEDGLLKLSEGKVNGRRPVAITFDDGFRDFHTTAWPVLRRCGFTATMYLPTAFVRQRRTTLRGKECLTWNEVRELRAHGVRFGSHTVTHPKLHEMTSPEIERELTFSKKSLEHELGEEIASFAYPYAFPQEDRSFKRTISRLLRRWGYRSCVTTVVGRSQTVNDPLFLKRLPINSCDDRELFEAKLAGAYDWLGSAQYAYRQIKSWTDARRRRHYTQERHTEAAAE